MCPEANHGSPNSGWTSEEIREMLQKTTGSMMHAAILIMASSGVRSGGLELKWGDIDPVYLKDGKPVAGKNVPEMSGTAEPACAKMCVYRGSSEEYVTFMTPEAYKALMEYKADWEEEVGRAPGPEDPVFKRGGSEPVFKRGGSEPKDPVFKRGGSEPKDPVFKRGGSEPKDPVFKRGGSEPIQLRYEMITKRVRMIAKKAGVQKRSDANGKLYKVPVSNGFRRWFNKVITDAPTDGSIGSFRKKEHMIGHLGTSGQDNVYYHTNPMELAAQYLRAVPALTLTDEGLLHIERKEMHKEMREVREDLAVLQRKQETRTDAAERQNTDRETISYQRGDEEPK